MNEPFTAERAYVRALRRLARRDHTCAEIEQGLRRVGCEPGVIEEVVARLTRDGYLDDARYARGFARARLEHRGHGRLRVESALQRRGVSRETARGGVRQALKEVPESAILDRVAESYWRRRTRVPAERRLRALHAFLLRRGFPADVVYQRIAPYRDEVRRLHEAAEESA